MLGMQAQGVDVPDGAAKQVAMQLHVRLPVVGVDVEALQDGRDAFGNGPAIIVAHQQALAFQAAGHTMADFMY